MREIGHGGEVRVAVHAGQAGGAVHGGAKHVGQDGHGAAVGTRRGTVAVAGEAVIVRGRLHGLRVNHARRRQAAREAHQDYESVGHNGID